MTGMGPGTPERPGPLAERLLGFLTSGNAQSPYIIGDLREEFRDLVRQRGRILAGFWYWGQVLGIGLPAAFRSLCGSGGGGMDHVFQDVVFCLRTLRKRRVFAVVSVATLGLGIGATTTMYGVVHTVLRTDLPYRDAHQLVSVWQTGPDPGKEAEEAGARWERVQLTYPQFRRLREASEVLEGVAAFNPSSSTSSSMILTGGEQPLRVRVGVSSASFFSVLGLEPFLGRGFLPGEDASVPGQAANVTVLGYDFWRSRFAGSGDVLGQSLTLDDRTFTIVGILGPEFLLHSGDQPGMSVGQEDIWIPIGQPGWRFGGMNDSARDWEVVGRLSPGATVEQAEAEAIAVLAGVYEGIENHIRVIPRAVDEGLTLDPRLVLMTAATGLLLLIVFLNVAILLLGELHGRKQEISTRVALGAGRGRILRQLLTEGMVLGILGSGIGVLVTVVGTRTLVALAPPLPRIDELTVNGSVLPFATLLGIVGAIFFGILPGFVGAGSSDSASLSAAASRTTTGKGRRFQRGLVVGEVALTVLLLVSGGLLTRSLFRLLAVDTGFQAENVATVRVSLSSSAQDPEVFSAFARDLIRELESDPEISRASGAGGLPFGAGLIGGDGLTLGGRDQGPSGQTSARRIHVLPGFHETLGIPILAGRGFTESEGPGTPPVMLVSESFAQRSWPDRSPVGETVLHWGEPRTVVGIVGDVLLEGLGVDHEPSFYVPLKQIPRSEIDIVARTTGDPGKVLRRMRQAVWAVNGDLPVTRTSTMASLVARSAADERYRTLLMVAFAVVATILAAGGVFGVTARSVARRRREMGLRIALGARKSGVLGMVIGGSLRSGLLGTALGLMGALLVSRLLSGFLFGIQTWDPVTYVSVACLVTAICAGASFFPARAATKVDPAEALRV